MKYYVIQVRTKAEQKYIDLFEAACAASGAQIKLYFPQREINERKQGKVSKQVKPVFPGYVFVEMDAGEELARSMPLFRRTAGFCRFLRANDNIIELSGSDLEIVLHFAKRMGPVAGLSKAYFNEHDKIVVTEGPLTGLEGLIIKVDKRKGRAKIKLDFCDEAFTVDLGFEVMETKKA